LDSSAIAMNGKDSSECTGPETIKQMLEHLQTKYRDGIDKISPEEKRHHHDMLKNIVEMVGVMRKDVEKSLDAANHGKMVLKISGSFPVDFTGSICVPQADELNVAFNATLRRNSVIENPPQVLVESITVEENFNHILDGPESPNYLLKEQEVYVKLESMEQADYVRGLSSHLRSVMVKLPSDPRRSICLLLSDPSKDTHTRAAYREIGTLITRLKQVDAQLTALGAVPGRGGLPELSDKLIPVEVFDDTVKRLQETPGQKYNLHGFLCTRIRVDKRKRQETLEPLIDERINVLLRLSQFDPDEFPFVVEREFTGK
jgi:hypothetical protein